MIRKMLSFSWICLLVLLSSASYAQHAENNRQVLEFTPGTLTQQQAILLDSPAPFIASSLVWETDELPGTPRLRSQDDAGNWSEWQTLSPDPHATFEAPKYISSLFFLPAGTQLVELAFDGSGINFQSGYLHLYNPGKTIAGEGVSDNPVSRSCPCPQPEYQGRLDWCPSGDCPVDSTPEPTTVTHIIIHHSAGVNASSDWAAVVRSIWDYHVNSNGWDDIGYNWLVDPNGVLYEGRPDGLQGAHFCGQNPNTTGLCMMGNFQTVFPSGASLSLLRKFLGWRTCELGVDPTDFGFHEGSGLSLYYISGHRDGCSTACPGDQFYPEFPALRQSVKDFIDAGCIEVAAPIDLSATALSNTSVLLEWTETSDAGTGYELERSSETANNFQWIGSVNSSTLDFTDNNLVPGNYYYRVRGFGPQGNGNFSNEAFVSTIGVSVGTQWNPEFVLLSPTPFGESLQIQLSDSYTGIIHMQLLAVDGRMIRDLGTFDKQHLDLQQTWDLSDLSSGVYFIRLEADGQSLVLKSIKQ
ncbi:MAG: N-acetylmuramoyl-L-alanine amidase [Saprospiraceae bacterium]|nr:N-acetylmuramoyl-L-alanine amidase [Saprospiraceae bacterium]